MMGAWSATSSKQRSESVCRRTLRTAWRPRSSDGRDRRCGLVPTSSAAAQQRRLLERHTAMPFTADHAVVGKAGQNPRQCLRGHAELGGDVLLCGFELYFAALDAVMCELAQVVGNALGAGALQAQMQVLEQCIDRSRRRRVIAFENDGDSAITVRSASLRICSRVLSQRGWAANS